ncbi:hypothetical protein BO71DRAFT_394361, partial [Aspergillus ellipticus CBS 707.79]
MDRCDELDSLADSDPGKDIKWLRVSDLEARDTDSFRAASHNRLLTPRDDRSDL